MSKKVKRLFEQFRPENYQLEIHADAEKMTFRGSVIISGKKAGRPSRRITLHQKDLNVKKVEIIYHAKKGPEKVNLARVNLHKSYDEVRLHAENLLYPGSYTLKLEFEGKITKPMHGLYPCFFEHEGKQKKLLATQFESHHAREVFPCIDEPEAKATFDLTLVAPKQDVVLSNTPIKNRSTLSENNAYQTTTFEATPVMSTYLLAWVIGELHSVESETKDGIAIRTWSTVAHPKPFLRYANDEAVTILEFFTDYFKTPFPLKKLDQVALPDFESGAMENWGLITYREIALLADPINRSISVEQYVSMVVAHEISHQWFGNLVTMKWWDDLWLNESFASLMEHIAPDSLHPDWFQWEQYTIQDVLASSNRDAYKDVQPVRVDVMHPDEIATLFDPAIVYAKGGRLLKMLREYIGDEAFREGLRDYFETYKFKNTTRDDLWSALSKSSGIDINKFMNSWLEQSGMPLLSVTPTTDKLHLEQKRLLLDGDGKLEKWPIPLFANHPLAVDLLESKSVDVSRPKSEEPVIFNVNASTHMVVHYKDELTRAQIADSVVKQKIKSEARINILNDMILLSRKGEDSVVNALQLVTQCVDEPRDAVWQQMSRVISLAGGLTEGDDEAEATLKKLRVGLAKNWYTKLDWEDAKEDSPNTKGLRQTILSLMTSGEDKGTLKEASQRYSNVRKVEDLPAEQRGLIIGSVVRAGEDVIDDLIRQYKTTSNPDVQLSISSGLCSTKDPKTAKYIIEQALGEKGFVRPQDIPRWYAYLMRNLHTREHAWNWLTANWDRLLDIFGGGKSLDNFIVYTAGPLNTQQWQAEFEKFFKPKIDEPSLKRNIKIALSEIEARVEWRKREEAKVLSYLQKYKQSK